MPVKRLGVANPVANTSVVLTISDVTGVASVIVANKGAIAAQVTIYVDPVESGGNPNNRAYIVNALEVGVGQSFETFRFAIDVGDIVYVAASTPDCAFSTNLAYESGGKTNVLYQVNQPGSPQIGDIWIDSSNESMYVYNGSDFNFIATAAPIGPTGPTGPSGPSGPTGATGPQGSSVRVLGTYATLELLEADNPIGAIGDAYVVGVILYAWSDLNQQWAAIGPVGITGPTGVIGATGPAGIGGQDGPTGAVGPTGPSGGPTGPAGATGAVGATGATGTVGATGAAGSTTFSGTTDATAASITIDEVAYSAIARLSVTNNGTTAYQFNSHYSGDDPTIFVLGGATIAFNLANAGHPFKLQNDVGAGFVDISSGLIHVSTTGTVLTNASAQGQASGTLYWNVPITAASGGYRYICSVHAGMVGTITHKSMSLI